MEKKHVYVELMDDIYSLNRKDSMHIFEPEIFIDNTAICAREEENLLLLPMVCILGVVFNDSELMSLLCATFDNLTRTDLSKMNEKSMSKWIAKLCEVRLVFDPGVEATVLLKIDCLKHAASYNANKVFKGSWCDGIKVHEIEFYESHDLDVSLKVAATVVFGHDLGDSMGKCARSLESKHVMSKSEILDKIEPLGFGAELKLRKTCRLIMHEMTMRVYSNALFEIELSNAFTLCDNHLYEEEGDPKDLGIVENIDPFGPYIFGLEEKANVCKLKVSDTKPLLRIPSYGAQLWPLEPVLSCDEFGCIEGHVRNACEHCSESCVYAVIYNQLEFPLCFPFDCSNLKSGCGPKIRANFLLNSACVRIAMMKSGGEFSVQLICGEFDLFFAMNEKLCPAVANRNENECVLNHDQLLSMFCLLLDCSHRVHMLGFRMFYEVEWLEDHAKSNFGCVPDFCMNSLMNQDFEDASMICLLIEQNLNFELSFLLLSGMYRRNVTSKCLVIEKIAQLNLECSDLSLHEYHDNVLLVNDNSAVLCEHVLVLKAAALFYQLREVVRSDSVFYDSEERIVCSLFGLEPTALIGSFWSTWFDDRHVCTLHDLIRFKAVKHLKYTELYDSLNNDRIFSIHVNFIIVLILLNLKQEAERDDFDCFNTCQPSFLEPKYFKVSAEFSRNLVLKLFRLLLYHVMSIKLLRILP